MTLRQDILKQYFSKSAIGGTISINDLRERDFNGESLNEEERTALQNFDRFRIELLNAQPDDMSFHEQYRQLQVMANLADWHDFLDLSKLK